MFKLFLSAPLVGDRVVIYPRGRRGIYCADYHFAGQHHRKSLRTSNRKIAERRARELEAQLTNGRAPPSARPTSIASAIDAFMSSKRADGIAKRTLGKYETELNNWAGFLKDTLNLTTLQRVSVSAIDRYKAHRKEIDKLRDYTLYNLIIIHKTFLKWCHRRGLLASNPLADLALREPRRRRRHPAATFEQVTAILARAQGSLFAVLSLLAFTGLRIGEARALNAEDIDLSGAMLHVRPRGDYRPKTERSERAVPLHRRLLAILGAMTIPSTGPLFTAPPSHRYPAGGNRINVSDTNEQFLSLARQCGFVAGRDNLGLTLHSLRRFFKTHCLDSGVPKPMVDAWLGHSDQQDMDSFYYNSQKSKEWMGRVPFGEPGVADLKKFTGDTDEKLN